MNVSANETARCGASAPVPEKKPSVGFKIVDCILIAGILLPLLGGIVIRVLTHPVESGISITGAVILAEFDFPLQKLQLTETQVNSWLVMASISALCPHQSAEAPDAAHPESAGHAAAASAHQ